MAAITVEAFLSFESREFLPREGIVALQATTSFSVGKVKVPPAFPQSCADGKTKTFPSRRNGGEDIVDRLRVISFDRMNLELEISISVRVSQEFPGRSRAEEEATRARDTPKFTRKQQIVTKKRGPMRKYVEVEHPNEAPRYRLNPTPCGLPISDSNYLG